MLSFSFCWVDLALLGVTSSLETATRQSVWRKERLLKDERVDAPLRDTSDIFVVITRDMLWSWTR